MVGPNGRRRHMDTVRGLDMDHPSSSVGRATPTRTRVPRAVLVVGGTIIALIALALVVVVAVPKGPTVYDPGSPEAAFQAFYRAFEAGDAEGAYGLLASDVTDQLTLVVYRRLDSEQAWQRSEDRRVVLLGSDRTGDRTNLRLRIEDRKSVV